MNKYTAIDYETTGLNAYKGNKIFAYIISNLQNDNIESYINRLDWSSNKQNKKSFNYLNNYWQDTNKIKIAHNLKFELGFTKMIGINIPKNTEYHDTMILSQLIYNNLSSYKLEKLHQEFIGVEESQEFDKWDYEVKKHKELQNRIFKNLEKKILTRQYKQLIDKMKNKGIDPLIKNKMNYGLIPLNIMNNYQKSDGERTLNLFFPLWEEIQKDKKLLSLYKIEIELIVASQCMEQTGIMIDYHKCKELIEWLSSELNDSITILNKELPLNNKNEFININSHLQLGTALYENMNFPIIDRSKKTGVPSTSTPTLEKLLKQYPEQILFDHILKYRAYSKGITTIKKYLTLAGRTKRIHPNINTNQAKTGRQSINNPALQTVSKNQSIGVKYPIPARQCFRPDPGSVLLSVDYSGIELWLIIEIANEQFLIDILKKDPNFNVHSYCCDIFTGSKNWRKRNEKDKYLIRAGMKNYDFGVPYGGKFDVVTAGLSNYYSYAERKVGNKRFSLHFPGIYNFSKNQKHQAERFGFVKTIFGRQLYIDHGMEYIAANYIVQGTAAQILKIGQVKLSKYFERSWNNEVKLIFSVHDENLISCPRIIWNNLNDRKKLYTMINLLMTDISEIKINLTTEMKVIKTNWSEGEVYNE